MTPRPRRSVLLLLASLALAACERPETRARAAVAAFEPHRAPVAAQLARVQALGALALPPADERLASPGVPLTARDEQGKNLLVVPAEQLAHLAVEPTPRPFLFADPYAVDVARWSEGLERVDATHPRAVASFCERFESLRYVLIVKTVTYRPPRLDRDEGGEPVYRSGVYSGEAHLYGLDGQRLGAFTFSAANSSMTLPVPDDGRPDKVLSDLAFEAQKKLHAAVLRHLPDTRWP